MAYSFSFTSTVYAGDATVVRWTYTFQARSTLASLVLVPNVKLLWNGYTLVVKEPSEREAL